MRVIVLEETMEFANQVSEVEAIISFINNRLEESDYHFSHMVIDDREVYFDFDEYLCEHIREIETIEIKVKTVTEFAHELLFSAEEYLERATPEIERLVEEFYNGPTEESWHHFAQFLEGMEWLDSMIRSIDQSSYVPQNWDKYLIAQANLQNELQQLEEALLNSDHTLTADIIHYELSPILEALAQAIQATIDSEVERAELN